MRPNLNSADKFDPDRTQRIRQIIDDCVRRRAAGEMLRDEMLTEAHPDLLPELGDELRHLHLIQQARQQADTSASASTIGQRGLRVRCPHCQNGCDRSSAREIWPLTAFLAPR